MALGDPYLIADIKFQSSFDKGGDALKAAIAFLFGFLFSPFEDIEYEALGFFKSKLIELLI